MAREVSENQKYVRLITNYCLLDSTHCLLDEMKEGMKTLDVLPCIQQFPDKFEEALCGGQETSLDARAVDLLFKIAYAIPGSNARPIQERAVVYWRDYLQDCEGRHFRIISRG